MNATDWKPEKPLRDRDILRAFRLEHVGEPCQICEADWGQEIHHVRYRSRRGGDEATNLMWLCRRCHDDLHAGRMSL